MLQEVHQEIYQKINTIQNKGKYKEGIVQDKEVLLYKSYTISEPSRPLSSEPILFKKKLII